jgi:predicted lipid-binding transport protein (Tim44 family)
VEAGPWGRGATPRAEHAPAEEALPRVVMGFGGCLLRLVLLVVLLFLASFGGMLLFAGSVFRIF